MKGIIILVLLIINIPVYKCISKLFFEDYDDFLQSIRYSFTPDLFSLFKGEYWKDRVSEMKLGFFIFSCAIVVIFEYLIITSIIAVL